MLEAAEKLTVMSQCTGSLPVTRAVPLAPKRGKDSKGVQFDPEIHTGKTNADGSWRRKRGTAKRSAVDNGPTHESLLALSDKLISLGHETDAALAQAISEDESCTSGGLAKVVLGGLDGPARQRAMTSLEAIALQNGVDL